MEANEQARTNLLKIKGKVIKVEPSKKGYGYTLKELATGKQSYFYNNWKLNILPEQDYIFYLNIKLGQNKYYCLYQSHKLVSSVELAKAQADPKQQGNQEKFYQQTQAQELQRKTQLIQEQRITNLKLVQKIKLLKQLLNQKEAQRLAEADQYQTQLKEQNRLIKLNELELEKKISPYNSIERLYYKESKTPEQEKYLWELTNLFNKDSQNIF